VSNSNLMGPYRGRAQGGLPRLATWTVAQHVAKPGLEPQPGMKPSLHSNKAVILKWSLDPHLVVWIVIQHEAVELKQLQVWMAAVAQEHLFACRKDACSGHNSARSCATGHQNHTCRQLIGAHGVTGAVVPHPSDFESTSTTSTHAPNCKAIQASNQR